MLRTNKSWSLIGWIAYTLALLIAFGTRHINYVLVIWLPLAMAGCLLWQRSRGQRRLRSGLLKIGIALACFVGLILVIIVLGAIVGVATSN